MVEFRLAQLEDLGDIVATYNSTVASRRVTADLEPVSVESKKDWFLTHNSTRPILIVLSDNNYAGWMSFSSFYGRPAYNETVELSIYLDENYRGKGIGKTCLLKAIELGPTIGIHNFLGFIFGHNAPSLRLFYSFGFEKWGHLPGVANMDGEWRDLIIVGKKL